MPAPANRPRWALASPSHRQAPRSPLPPAPGTRSRGPKRKCISSAALGFWMCFCSLAWGRGADRRVGAGERARGGRGAVPGHAGPHPPCQLSGTGWPCPHQQVEGQLGLLETVHKLSLRGWPCPQREDALWTGRGGPDVSLASPLSPCPAGLASFHLPRSGVTLPPAPPRTAPHLPAPSSPSSSPSCADSAA